MSKKRTEKVTDRIYEAVCRLLLDKKIPYDRISIQDIVDEASVCRSSFYRNYLEKDEIFVRQFYEIYGTGNSDHNSQETVDTGYLLKYIFTSAKDNRRFFLAYYTASPKKYYEMISQHIIASNTTKEIRQLNKEDYYYFACKAWLCVGILTEWLQRDCDASVEEMVEIMMNFKIE